MCIRYRRVLSLRLIIAPITSCASLCVRIRSRRLSEFQLYEAVSSAAGPTLSIRSADRVPLSPGVRALYQPLSAPRPGPWPPRSALFVRARLTLHGVAVSPRHVHCRVSQGFEKDLVQIRGIFPWVLGFPPRFRPLPPGDRGDRGAADREAGSGRSGRGASARALPGAVLPQLRVLSAGLQLLRLLFSAFRPEFTMTSLTRLLARVWPQSVQGGIQAPQRVCARQGEETGPGRRARRSRS